MATSHLSCVAFGRLSQCCATPASRPVLRVLAWHGQSQALSAWRLCMPACNPDPSRVFHMHCCLQDVPDMEEEITPAVVACGSEYTASITRRGQLLTWGLGSRGELGHEMPHAGEVSCRLLALCWKQPSSLFGPCLKAPWMLLALRTL